jgi:hypothetical protein
MRREVVALVVPFRDEADIIADMIRFHLDQGVDFVVALDNGSVDKSAAMAAYVDPSRVTVLRDPEHRAQHREHGDRLALRAAEMGADWVIPADADEFWYPASGDYRTEMARGANILRAHWANFLPSPYPWKAFDQVGDFAGRQYENWIPKVAFRAADLVGVEQGFHNASVRDRREAQSSNLVVYHYPVRSYGQFERKVRNAGTAHARNPEAQANANFAWHTRGWYRDYLAGKLPEVYEALSAGKNQVQDRRMRDYWFSRGLGSVGPDFAEAGA